MRVLDIGCGWGGLALTLARDYGAQVLGVTLSEEQHRIATDAPQEAGLDDQVEFRLTDYRHVDETFDRDRLGRHVRACRACRITANTSATSTTGWSPTAWR